MNLNVTPISLATVANGLADRPTIDLGDPNAIGTRQIHDIIGPEPHRVELPRPAPQSITKLASMSLISMPRPSPETKPTLRGVLHVVVALTAIPATVWLAVHARPGVSTTLSIVYGAALILVFGTSGLYHTPHWSLPARRRMRRLDHSMIYVLIAASYAPFAQQLTPLPRAIVSSISIGGGLLGVVKAHVWERAPRALTTALYVSVGWCIAPFIPQLWARIGPSPTILLLLGGLLYTAGAIVYALRRPNPWPRTFGHHEVNHLLGVTGAVAHYVAISRLLA